MKIEKQPLSDSPVFTIVFLHGWGMNSEVFSRFIKYLPDSDVFWQDEVRLRAIDLPGFGGASQTQLEEYSLETLCSYVSERLPQHCILCGWSLGGLVAMRLALNNDPNIAALVNICSSPKFVADEDWPGISHEVFHSFEQQLKNNYRNLIKRFIAIQTMGLTDQRQNSKLLFEDVMKLPAPSAKAMKEGLNILLTTDLRNEYSKLQVPGLNIYGKLDSLVPPAAFERIKTMSQHDNHFIIDKASHAPFVSHPEKIAEILKKFILSI